MTEERCHGWINRWTTGATGATGRFATLSTMSHFPRSSSTNMTAAWHRERDGAYSVTIPTRPNSTACAGRFQLRPSPARASMGTCLLVALFDNGHLDTVAAVGRAAAGLPPAQITHRLLLRRPPLHSRHRCSCCGWTSASPGHPSSSPATATSTHSPPLFVLRLDFRQFKLPISPLLP
jgi:hypothetical protein